MAVSERGGRVQACRWWQGVLLGHGQFEVYSRCPCVLGEYLADYAIQQGASINE